MPLTATTDPPFQNLGGQGRKALDPLNKGYYGFYGSDAWTPSVNLYETAHTYLVCVDLAGVDKDKIDVEVHENRLKLRGKRLVPMKHDGSEEATEREARKVRIHLMEIDHGTFSREVELPDNVREEKISATHRNGLLWIEIPKA